MTVSTKSGNVSDSVKCLQSLTHLTNKLIFCVLYISDIKMDYFSFTVKIVIILVRSGRICQKFLMENLRKMFIVLLL